jgi:hypothetical protein
MPPVTRFVSDPFADIEVSTDLSHRLNGMALLLEYLARSGTKDRAEAVRLLDAIIDGADGAIEMLPGDSECGAVCLTTIQPPAHVPSDAAAR